MTISADSKRQGWRQVIIGMTLYFVLIISLNGLNASLQLSKPLLIAFTFVPILAALWATLGWVRVVRSRDELQQRIISESAHWALGLTAVVTFSYGMLEESAGLPRLSMTSVLALIALTFTIGQLVARRRFQ